MPAEKGRKNKFECTKAAKVKEILNIGEHKIKYE